MPAGHIWHVERVTAEATYPLRQQVLRPHQSLAEVGFAGEDDPETAHFGAYPDGGGDCGIVGVVTVLRQFPAARGADEPDRWWRLRGMATAPDWRGRGAGSALVAAAADYVAAHYGTVLWCYARVSAAGFYRAEGFETTGDPWDEPALGPHVAMWRAVPRPA